MFPVAPPPFPNPKKMVYCQVLGPKKEPSSGRVFVTAVPMASRLFSQTVLPHQSGNSLPLSPRASAEMTMHSAVPMSRAPDRT